MTGKRLAQPDLGYNEKRRRLALLLAPLLLLFCVQLITLGDPARVAAWLFPAFLGAALTYLSLLGLILGLELLLGRLWAGFLIPAVPLLALAVANSMKEKINGAPVVLSDLAMAAHLGTLVGFVPPELRPGGWVWFAILAALAGAGVLFWLDWKGAPVRPGRERKRQGLAAALALLTLGMILPQGYVAGPPGEEQAERNRRLGLAGGFYAAVLNQGEPRVGDYDKEAMASLLEQMGETTQVPSSQVEEVDPPTPAAPAVEPHVILIMSESFCDPAVVLPGVEMTGDPIPNYHALSRLWPSGTFYSNTYAGGTGNVEMEVFTGVPLALLGEGEDLTTIREAGAYDRLPSIVKSFGQAGYSTHFIHNYTTRLYDREDHMPRIGFDEMVFEPDFPEDAPRSGPYLSDEALMDKLIETFEDREEGEKLFLFGLTMENHQPYYEGKFPVPCGLEPKSELLDGEAMGAVDALLTGLQGADRALGKLVDYLEDCGEPVLLVFWGDHLPGLAMSDWTTVYSRLGYVDTWDTLEWDAETMKKMHQTEFLVWNNYDAALDVPSTVSALSLGSQILGWAGVEKPLYFRWVSQALDTMALYRTRLYIAADGTPYKQPPPEDEAVVEMYRSLVYDILYGEGYVTGELEEE